jgi:very-short-patch-repair endonuclease
MSAQPLRAANAKEPFADTPLARLCRYYLDCISADDAGEVSCFSDDAAEPGYLELDPAWLYGRETACAQAELQPFRERYARSLVPRALKVGLLLLVQSAQLKSGASARKLVPLLLLNAAFDREGRLVVERESVSLATAAVRELTRLHGPELQFELAQLEQALGFDELTADTTDLQRIVRRLRELRPEWGWQDEGRAGGLASLPPGVHPRAVLMMLDAPRYTHGLEIELRKLARLTEAQYRDTALGHLLLGAPGTEHTVEDSRILEVLPMNSEQRQAVLLGLTRPLSVVTGPPGTGKSQVISNLLVNCAWQDRQTLFTSKNNKAVDVVDERVNGLGPQPVMVRLGAGEHQTKLAANVDNLLAAVVTNDDLRAYNEVADMYEAQVRQLKAVETQEAAALQLRNEALALEAELAAFRALYEESGFAQLRHLQTARIEHALHRFVSALDAAAPRQALRWQRLLWPAVWLWRRRELTAAWQGLRRALEDNGVSVGFEPALDRRGHGELRELASAAKQLVHACKLVQRHVELVRQMRQASLPELAQQRLELVHEMSAVARKLWSDWVRIRGAKMSPVMRHALQQYAGMLKAVARAGSEDSLPDTFRRQYREFQHKAQQFLPCFAVTALSVHNRVAFGAGVFDLVVFDEASQCDIASALPLLYRARRVAVIGDPKQLAHISRVRQSRDAQMLARAGLHGYEAWMYSTQSLFALVAAHAPEDARVHLRDHHRSHPDIIGFSNRYFYDRHLRVATRTERLVTVADEAGVRWLDVAGQTVRGPGGSSGNPKEVAAVVAELKRLVDSGYKGTLGVVTPFRHQVELIEQAIRRDAGLHRTLVAEHALQVNTAHGFQGDERDLMIFSVVLSEGASAGAVRFLQTEANVFNVAVTRARAHLLVVGDLSWCGNCEVEHLRHFARYVSQLGQLPAAPDVLPEYGPSYPFTEHPTASEAEQRLYEALYAAGVRPVPRVSVPPYTVDLAVFDGMRRLAVDVDAAAGAEYLELEDLRQRQVRTQRLLEQGWQVCLFWPVQVRDDLHWCVRQVQAWLRDGSAADEY